MRGKHVAYHRHKSNPRNIPAHAGKTYRHDLDFARFEEHPRACGENTTFVQIERSSSGTSPRMRGKRRFRRCVSGRNRNIPAHAGKTRLERSVDRVSPEHPRACGENYSATFSKSSYQGTSPRMRGKQIRIRGDSYIHRNIPAHAGKTTSMPKSS